METNTKSWWKEPTRQQWYTFAAAWFGWVMDAFDFTIFLVVMPKIAKEFNISVTVAASAISITLLTRILGGFVAGYAADRWGRKLPLMISIVWFSVCNGAVAFAPSFAALFALRLLFGFGMGAEWTVGTTMALENWPARSRSIASGILQASWPVGFLLAGITASIVVPQYGWRNLFLISIVPALLALPIRFFVPESAEWEKAKSVQKKETSWSDLKKPDVVGDLVWASCFVGASMAVYQALASLYPTLLQNQLGIPIDDVGKYLAVLNLGLLIGTITFGVMSMKRGLGQTIIPCSILVILVSPIYLGYIPQPHFLKLGAFIVGAALGSIYGIYPFLLVNIFGSDIRARAIGIVTHIGAALAAFAPTLVAALSGVRNFSLPLAMGSVASVGLVLVIIVLSIRLNKLSFSK